MHNMVLRMGVTCAPQHPCLDPLAGAPRRQVRALILAAATSCNVYGVSSDSVGMMLAQNKIHHGQVLARPVVSHPGPFSPRTVLSLTVAVARASHTVKVTAGKPALQPCPGCSAGSRRGDVWTVARGGDNAASTPWHCDGTILIVAAATVAAAAVDTPQGLAQVARR